MFDVSQPMLVFDSPCYTPYTKIMYGWGFNLYEYHMDTPRGLFFSHIEEAIMFAHRYGARFVMDPRAAPDRVDVLQYILTRQNEDEEPIPLEDGRCTSRRSPAQRVQLARLHGRPDDYYLSKEKEELELAPVEEAAEESEYAGSSTNYAGGMARKKAEPEFEFATASIDWFGEK